MKRTAAATAARMRATDERMATRLRSRGWHLVPPEDTQAVVDRLRELLAEDDPCADGCPDPAAHAEGGHDV